MGLLISFISLNNVPSIDIPLNLVFVNSNQPDTTKSNEFLINPIVYKFNYFGPFEDIIHLFNYGNEIKISNLTTVIQWFSSSKTINFAGQDLQINPSSVKFTIEIKKLCILFNFKSSRIVQDHSIYSRFIKRAIVDGF
ncbi:hypothetical protein ACTA71_000077 [Dictyostelium dimigraforme]